MSRRAQVWRLAPVAPPCFADRLIWLEFLVSAAEEPAVGQRQVLLVEKGQPVRFNHRFPFCDACTAEHKAAMQAANKCRPAFLTDMLPKEPSHAA
jgi:hypothetical protein